MGKRLTLLIFCFKLLFVINTKNNGGVMFEKLIVARHGDYEVNSGGLTERGKKQVTDLAQRIAQELKNGERIRLIASPVKRTKESADIFSTVLGIQYEENIHLVSSDGELDPGQGDEILKIINSCDHECLILMSHYEVAKYVPAIFGKEVLGTNFRNTVVGKGEARFIDCQKKEEKFLY